MSAWFLNSELSTYCTKLICGIMVDSVLQIGYLANKCLGGSIYCISHCSVKHVSTILWHSCIIFLLQYSKLSNYLVWAFKLSVLHYQVLILLIIVKQIHCNQFFTFSMTLTLSLSMVVVYNSGDRQGKLWLPQFSHF